MKTNLSDIVQRRIIGNSINASTTNRYTPVYNIIQMMRIALAGQEHWGKFVVIEPWGTQGMMFSNEKFATPEGIYEFLYELPIDSAVTRYCTPSQYLSNINFNIYVVSVENEPKLVAIPNDTGIKAPGVNVLQHVKDVTAKKYKEYVTEYPMDIATGV